MIIKRMKKIHWNMNIYKNYNKRCLDFLGALLALLLLF